MAMVYVKIAAASAIMLTAAGASSLLAEEKGDRSVEQYTCKDIMRDSGPSRDIAIAFVHGYLLGKANATTFNVEMLQQQTQAFINRCLDNPNEKALDAC
jgi:HdeA/HdeB family